MRKEMYGMLGDLYGLQQNQRDEICVIQVSYQEYFRKLDRIEGSDIDLDRGRIVRMAMEYTVIAGGQGEEIKLEDELRLQQLMTKKQELIEQVEVNNGQLSARQKMIQSQDGNVTQKTEALDLTLGELDTSVQEAQLDDSYKIYILDQNTDNDDIRNRRRVAHLQHYLKIVDEFKKAGRTRGEAQRKLNQMLGKYPVGVFNNKTMNGSIEIVSIFIWKYAERWVNFSYYVMCLQQTNTWRYIVDHYAAIWYARSRGTWNLAKLSDEEKAFAKLDVNTLYDAHIERQIGKVATTRALMGGISICNKKEKENELLIENNVFYEGSNFTIVYIRNLNIKARQIRFLIYKIRFQKQNIGKFYVAKVDVHNVISTLIKCNIIAPGSTSLNAYKWGSFNVNIFTSALSGSMESLLNSNESQYENIKPQQYVKDWIQLYQNLTKEDQKNEITIHVHQTLIYQKINVLHILFCAYQKDKVVFLKINVNNIKIDKFVKIKIFTINSVFGRKLKDNQMKCQNVESCEDCHHDYKKIKSVEEKLVFVQQNFKVDALIKRLLLFLYIIRIVLLYYQNIKCFWEYISQQCLEEKCSNIL